MSSNIKVAIRVRPLIQREKNEKLKEQWEVNQNNIYPIDTATGRRNGDIYSFDHIFNSMCCNVDVYNTVVHPVVDKAMSGINGTIFAYGQTSSGKTYTMMGNTTEHGLISLAVQNVFLSIEQSINRKFLLRVSYMEIYNEKIYDLLDMDTKIKISEDLQGSVTVNVREEVTNSAQKVYEIMKKGDKARRIGETNLNEKSSRSHTIFRIIIESSDINDTGAVTVAHLNLVDLAGSERANLTKATSLRLKEGAHINKSLSTLSLVMKQLSESQDFVNFRDSKLTRILQSSLGGNTLTAIICAVTPTALEETHSTLAFASRAKVVKNKPLVNEIVSDEALINKYAQEINKLKKDLEKANDNTNLQAQKIAHLEKCIISSTRKDSNKNRRKTWSGAADKSRPLPVIYEADILKLSNLSNEESEASLCDNTWTMKLPFYEKTISTPQETFSLNCSKNIRLISPDSYLTPKRSEESNINWLINSAETPVSVLRERAEYYEREFNSLKELTTQEKLLADHASEINALQSKFDRVKNELDREKMLKKELESTLQNQLEELKEENEKLKKEQLNCIEYEISLEMFEEKFKNREKELLESLHDARNLLNSFINNTDDEKNFTMCTNIRHFLDEYKSQLNRLKCHLESDQTLSAVQNLINEIKTINENILNNCNDCSEDFQDLLSIFKYVFELINILLCDEAVILDLENDKKILQQKEKTYDLIVSKPDEKIKNLSENILQYMDELTFCKNEITKYKELSKLETSLQADLDLTTDTNAKHNLNNTAMINSEHFSENNYYISDNESVEKLLRSKDTEIEALSDKIMEYIEQLTSLEDELQKLKAKSYENQFTQTEDIGNEDIDELRQKLLKYKNDLDSVNNLVTENNKEIQELKNKINIQEKNIIYYQDSLNLEKAENDAHQEEIKLLNAKLNDYELEKGTLSLKIEHLLSENSNFTSQLFSSQQMIIQLEKTVEKNQDEKNIKQAEIETLLTRITKYTNELTLVKDNHKHDIKLKDAEIKKLCNRLSEYVDEFNARKVHLELEIERQNLEIDHLSSEKNDMVQKLSNFTEKIALLEAQSRVYQDEIRSKNEEIDDLLSQIAEYKNEISIGQNELESVINIKDEQINELSNEMAILVEELNIHRNNEIKNIEINSDYNNQLSFLEEKVNQLERESKMAKEEIQLKNAEIEALLSQISNHENEIICIKEEYDAQLIMKENQIKDVFSQLSAVNEELNNCKKMYEASVVENNNKLKELSELRDYRKSLEFEKEKLNTKIEKLSGDNKGLLEQILKFQEKIMQSESNLMIEKDKVNQLTEELSAIKNMKHTGSIEKIKELKDAQVQCCLNNDDINEMKKLKQTLASKENNLKHLLDVTNQQRKLLEELEEKVSIIKTDNFCQTENMEYFNNNILLAETKKWSIKYSEMCNEYENNTKSVEEDLVLLNDKVDRLKLKLESSKCNIEHDKAKDNLKVQICLLQEKIAYYETTLKQKEELINQLELKNDEIVESNILLIDKHVLEIQKLSEKVMDQNKYIENLQKELVNLQNYKQNESILTREMSALSIKNEKYKKIVEEVTKRANSEISLYNSIADKLKSENNLLKTQFESEKKIRQSLQIELETKINTTLFGVDSLKLQEKINSLNEQNANLRKIVKDYQDKTYKRGYEINSMKKTIETLTNENNQLKKLNKELNNKVANSEAVMKAAKDNIDLLECEKKNYCENIRVLEETLEDTKFELHEMKTKEREKIKKLKRQSIHDSSRSLTNDDVNVTDSNREINICERCNLLDAQNNDKFQELESENKKLLKKNEDLIKLCKLRKSEIDDLKKKLSRT